jgi:hypothetical protein
MENLTDLLEYVKRNNLQEDFNKVLEVITSIEPGKSKDFWFILGNYAVCIEKEKA